MYYTHNDEYSFLKTQDNGVIFATRCNNLLYPSSPLEVPTRPVQPHAILACRCESYPTTTSNPLPTILTAYNYALPILSVVWYIFVSFYRELCMKIRYVSDIFVFILFLWGPCFLPCLFVFPCSV